MRTSLASAIMLFATLGCGSREVARGEEITVQAKDGQKVFGTYMQAKATNDRVILLYHQAKSNRHEYAPITPELNKLGFDTLAIDQRSGGEMWGHTNETVKARGQSTSYVEAYPDLQASVDWAVNKKYKTIVCVGSSYSAALNFLLAKDNDGKLTAIASFSPGEYLGKKDLVKDAAKQVKIPVYVTAGSTKEEEARVDEVLSKMESKEKVVCHKAGHGVHGASTLREDKNKEGAKENFDQFKKFLQKIM